VGKDVETLRFRTTTSLTDVEGQTHELKQRVHSVEVLSEQRFAGHADDIRDAHAKMWDEILHLKSNARGMAAVDQELRVSSNLQLQKLAAVVKRLGGSLLAFEKGATVTAPVETIGRETERIEQDLLNDAKHIHDIQSRSKGLPEGEAEREAIRLQAKTQAPGPAEEAMDMSVNLADQTQTDEDRESVGKEEELSATGAAFAQQLVDDAVFDGMGKAFEMMETPTPGEISEAPADRDGVASGDGGETDEREVANEYEEDEFDDVEDEVQNIGANGEEDKSGSVQESGGENATSTDSPSEHAAAAAMRLEPDASDAGAHARDQDDVEEPASALPAEGGGEEIATAPEGSEQVTAASSGDDGGVGSADLSAREEEIVEVALDGHEELVAGDGGSVGPGGGRAEQDSDAAGASSDVRHDGVGNSSDGKKAPEAIPASQSPVDDEATPVETAEEVDASYGDDDDIKPPTPPLPILESSGAPELPRSNDEVVQQPAATVPVLEEEEEPDESLGDSAGAADLLP
jgi:hypothetical protein